MFIEEFTNKADGVSGCPEQYKITSIGLGSRKSRIIRCNNIVHAAHRSFPVGSIIKSIGDYILHVSTQWGVAAELHDRNGRTVGARIIETAGESGVVRHIDSGWGSAVTVYEGTDAFGTCELRLVYISLETDSASHYKSHSACGSPVVAAITPRGFVVYGDDSKCEFVGGSALPASVSKCTGYNLKAIMFAPSGYATAIFSLGTKTILQLVNIEMEHYGQGCDLGNTEAFNIERTTEELPVVSAFTKNKRTIIIYPNMFDYNYTIKYSVISADPREVSINVHANKFSIIEFRKDFSVHKTIINASGVAIRTDEYEGSKYWHSGTYRIGAGSPYTQLDIHDESEVVYLAQTCNIVSPVREINKLLKGRIAHYIVPHISPQWYLKHEDDGRIVAVPAGVPLDYIPAPCDTHQRSEIYAAAILLGSPVNNDNVSCYTSGQEVISRYPFGNELTMHQQGRWTKYAKSHFSYTDPPISKWIFPEVGGCSPDVGCDEEIFIKCLKQMVHMVDFDKIHKEVVRPVICTYNEAAWCEEEYYPDTFVEDVLGGAYRAVLEVLGEG